MNENLNWRYAVKKFDPDFLVSEKQLWDITEAARLSPSSLGLQPYKLVIIEDRKIREQLIEHSWGQDKVANSSHLLLFASYKEISTELIDAHIELVKRVQNYGEEKAHAFRKMITGFIGSISREQLEQWSKHQAYLALGNTINTLAQMKIDSCPMEGFIAEKYDQILGLDKLGLTTTVILPIGKRASDDPYASLSKARKSRDEFTLFIK